MLSFSIVLTSQGITFLHAGSEFLRSKKGNENSYNAGDSVNAIDWDLKSRNIDVYEYVRQLVSLRRNHPAFRMRSNRDVAKHIVFADQQPGVVAYSINDAAALGDPWKRIHVLFNGKNQQIELSIPEGKWSIFSSNNHVERQHRAVSGKVLMTPYSCTILYQQ